MVGDCVNFERSKIDDIARFLKISQETYLAALTVLFMYVSFFKKVSNTRGPCLFEVGR